MFVFVVTRVRLVVASFRLFSILIKACFCWFSENVLAIVHIGAFMSFEVKVVSVL